MKWIEKSAFLLIVMIFAGLFVHAPLSVFFGSIFPGNALEIKAWKEILLAFLGVLTLFYVWRRKLWWLFRQKIMVVLAMLVCIHAFSALFGLARGLNLTQTIAGLLIDLRHLVFFGSVYIWLHERPSWKKPFFMLLIGGVSLVLVFGLLQLFFLPHDFLKVLGYSSNTIAPYLTVDQNYDFVRIVSTMRGPNPLGALAAVVMIFAASYVLFSQKKYTLKTFFFDKRCLIALAFFVAGALVLWASYSRSALLAAAIVLLAMTAYRYRRSLLKWQAAAAITVVFSATFVLFLTLGSTTLSNVFLHENPNGDNSVNSNDGHVESLIDGTKRMLAQPFGAGIGSTGSASLLGSEQQHLIIENQFLFIAHEIGWVGLGLYMWLFWLILQRLWAQRKWHHIACLSGLIALLVIGMLLPVFVDDTVAMVFFGLCGILLAKESSKSKKPRQNKAVFS